MAKSLDYAKIARAMADRAQQLNGAVVKVGIPAGKRYPDGTSIAYVATIHEFGAPEANIPMRSFMRSTRNKKRPEWARQLTEGSRAVLARQITLDDMLDAVGALAAGDMVQTIADRIPPPLAPSTVQARIRRARAANPKFGKRSLPVTISQPLNDTGTLIAHISYGTGQAGETFTGGKAIKG